MTLIEQAKEALELNNWEGGIILKHIAPDLARAVIAAGELAEAGARAEKHLEQLGSDGHGSGLTAALAAFHAATEGEG